MIMPDRLKIVVEGQNGIVRRRGARKKAAEGEPLRLNIGDTRQFSVVAVYGDREISLSPNAYTLSTLGAGVRVWSGRNRVSSLDYEKQQVAWADESADELEESNYVLTRGVAGRGGRFEAVKRTRENKTVEVTARLAIKPSIKGTINIVVGSESADK